LRRRNRDPDIAVMEDLDLLEDVEFYQWLQADGHAG